MSTGDATDPAGERPSFEEALGRLEAIVHDLEEGELGLAEALTRYETGIALLKQCFGLLEHAERRIELLSGFDAQGNPLTQPFDDLPTSGDNATVRSEPPATARQVGTQAPEEDAPSRGRRRTRPQSPTARAVEPTPPATTDMDEPGKLF